MAQVPGIFNAAQYFGSTTPSKDQQNSFWDQHSGSHSAGSFNGSAASVDPFATNQEYFVDGWDDWPDTDEFLSNDLAPNHHVNSFNVGSEKLIVPAREDSQTSSSSEDSTTPGMDPELNAWVEEETTPYGHPSYNNAALHGSGAAFFDGHFNGETNSAQQPDIMAQHDGRSYASVCQAGGTVAPVQDKNSAWQQNYQDSWAAMPSQQGFGAPVVPPELADTQASTPTATSWSQEPELGSWSPVFNHNDRSFVNSQQDVPSSTSQPQQFASPVQESWANSQRSQELYAHMPQGEGNLSPVGFFGHEEEHLDSGWSALAENDTQQADMWGNLSDLHRPEEKKPLGQVPMMERPFPENAVALEQSPSGVFQENLVSEPSEQHLMEQHPMYQSPSGVFQENVVAGPSEHLMKQHPMYQSPSGFFQTNSATQPLVNEGNYLGQLTFPPNLDVEPMLSNPNDLTASSESPSVELAHQESVGHVHLPPSQTDSIIKKPHYPEQMPPPSQLRTYAKNEAWPSQQDLRFQEEKSATEEMRQSPQFEPMASKDVQSSQQAVQTTGLIHELETSVGAPCNLLLGNEIAPPKKQLQQEVQKPGIISKQETFVGNPSHLILNDNSATTESPQTPQLNESLREPSQQDMLSTGLISEQKMSVWAPSNLLVSNNSTTMESPEMLQPNLPPRATPEQSLNTVTPVQSDSLWNVPGHYSATTEFSQKLLPNMPQRATPEQSVNTVAPVQPDSLQNVPGQHSTTSEFSQTMQPNLPPRATPEQSLNTVTPVQPDSLQNVPGHYSATTEFSQKMQPNIPQRATSEQSVNTVALVQPDSLRNLPGQPRATTEFSQKLPPNMPQRATSEQSVNTIAPVQPDSLQNIPGQHSATSEFSQTMQPNLPPRATPEQSVNTVASVQLDSLRNVPGQHSATTEFSQMLQPNLPPRATPGQSVNTDAPVQPDNLRNVPSHDTATTRFSQPPQLNMPPRATSEQSVSAVEPDSPRDAHQVAFLQKQLAGKAPAASPRTSLWMNTSSALLPTPCVLAPAAIVTPVEVTPQLHRNDQALPADKQVSPSTVGTTSAVVVPAVATVAVASQQIPAVPHTNEERNSVQEPPHTGVHAMPAVKQPTVALKQEQKTELSNLNSLASLLQGGQTQPKKKTSQPSVAPASHTDAESSQTASNPVQASHLSSSFTDIPQLGPSVDQLPGRSGMLSSQQIENQSFDSVGRTDELQHSHGRDYNDPNLHGRPTQSHDGSYYQDREDFSDKRDPYYDRDQRDFHNINSQNRRDRYDYEPDRRDHERSYYDRREPERRSHDRRREYDWRDSDYNRRSYDNSREYDRRSYDGRDYGNRDGYDNRDSYHGHGYSARQGRRGYDDDRGSREDVYRGSYHSGRSTPTSLDRNSPAPFDYSGSPYASHQYGYSPYTDSQSMDLYQYQYMMYLYQFHPQHYEQYCAQIGYYSGAGYTPEQLAQYYGGYGYENAQPTEQAPVEEVLQSEPERFTPLLYRVQHPLVQFSGGKLISLIGSEDTETPKCIIASVQMVFSTEEIEVIKLFPGPLSSRYSSRTEVMTFCEKRSSGTDLSADGVVKSLVWKILANLVKHSGAFVASDLAEVIMENWRSCNVPEKNEFVAPESQPPAEIDTSQHVTVFREMLLAGATKDALEYSMRYRLWGHAMMLASKLDKKVQHDVSSRFLKTMRDFDPIRTVYDHLSGRQPVALMTPDDWQRSLAAMVANPPRQHPHSIKKNIMCLGDTLISNEQVWAAHLCYLLAGEKFGFPTEEKTKMAVIGIDHRENMVSGRHLPLENLQMMEVLEYAFSLSNEEYFVPVLQSYKFIHANKLAEAGFTDEALHYAELIGHTIIKHPTNVNVTLVKDVRELTDRLQPDTQEAADLLEMLDKVLQTKETTSQISSSVTESESEVEEPLAESSASFFSGYDPSTNTPKHQTEQIEDTQRQLSYNEPPVSVPPVYQEPTAVHDYQQDSWPSGMPAGDNQESWPGGIDAQATQPELPPTMLPQSPEPAPQPPFFVPGPPVTQPLPQQNERSETMEQQSFYDRQWSEGARFEESNRIEPTPPKEPEPSKEAETMPKPVEKKKKPEAKRGSPSGGWLSGLLSKVMPRGPNEMILPDDSKKSIYWDEDLKKWVNTEEDEQEKAPPPPPPSDMQLGGGGPPMMSFGNVTPATSGTTTHSVGTPSFPSPAAPQQAIPGGIPAGMATPPSVSKFSRKAYGGGRLAKKYVDVLNLSGQTYNSPAMLPNSLLPTFPGPASDFNPAALFVPSPVNASSDEINNSQTASEPVVANPGSRPSSRNDNEDGAEQESQHSRSSSVSLTSAEVRSYMMPQVPDPPPQNAAPMFFDPSAFSQPKAQASPRKSRYPGQIRK